MKIVSILVVLIVVTGLGFVLASTEQPGTVVEKLYHTDDTSSPPMTEAKVDHNHEEEELDGIPIDQLPKDQPIDLVDVTIADLSTNREEFIKLAFYPPVSCSRFWHIFPKDSWKGCGFWYGPSMGQLTRPQTRFGFWQSRNHQVNNNNNGGQVTSCEFDTPLFLLRNSFGRNIRQSSKKVKGRIEFIRDTTVRTWGSFYATAIKLPIGNPSGQLTTYLGGQSIDVEALNCSTNLKMLEVQNWLQDQRCSFWIGPPPNYLATGQNGGLPGGVGLNSVCNFPEIDRHLQFSKLEGSTVRVDEAAKKVMGQISMMMLQEPGGSYRR